MDNAKLILTEPVLPPTQLDTLSRTSIYNNIAKSDPCAIDELSERRKKEVARDFESVLLNKLLGAMKDTIGDWGFDRDGASEQIQGLFWLHLARDIADKGGLGLWKDIYQFLDNKDQSRATAE